MEWVVTTGRTIDEAKDLALDALGVDELEAEFEVVEEPKVGLFGRLRREAKVRARVTPRQPRPKVDRRERGRRGRGRGGSGGGSNGRRRSKGGKGRGNKRRGEAKKDGPKRDAGQEDVATKDVARKDAAEKDDSAEQRGSGGQRRPGAKQGAQRSNAGDRTDAAADEGAPSASTGAVRGDGDSVGAREPAVQGVGTVMAAPEATEEQAAPGGAARPDEVGDQKGTEMSTVTVQEQGEAAKDFLEGLLDEFGLSGEVATELVDEDLIEIQVTGGDLGLLIGPKGQTLNAVQELARTYVMRTLEGTHEGRIRVDVSGYRQKRRAALERFTREVAEEVRSSGAAKSLEPMHPADRKVVHDTVNEIDGVRTISEGEEPRRRVVILPDED